MSRLVTRFARSRANQHAERTPGRAAGRPRLYAIAAAVLLVMAGAMGATQAQAQGPVQPEAMQFEPVDVTDIVNLTTGDLAYTIPLLEVPGPEGGYPLALSYHSGIGPNQQATWVGLGWSLNPGAVNRTVSGYPDDYDGDVVSTQYESDTRSGWGLSIGAGWGPVGVNMTYDHHSGMVGVNGTLSVTAMLGYEGPGSLGIYAGTSGVGVNAGIGAQIGDSPGAVGLGVRAGTQGVSASARASYGVMGGSINTDGVATMEADVGNASVSLSSNGTVGYSLGGGQGGFATMAAGPGPGVLMTDQMTIPIPLPYGAWVSIGWSEWEWFLSETHKESSYGFLHQNLYLQSPESTFRKFERRKNDSFLFASKDAYQVAAQGVSGVMEPFWRVPYTLVDSMVDGEDAPGDVQSAANTTREELLFRFIGDQGPNYATEFPSGGHLDDVVDPAQMYSRKIEPVFDDLSMLVGFIITDEQGKRYEFMQPVKNYYQYSFTEQYDPDGNSRNASEQSSAYASSWLLTAIKGPDYVDRDANDVPGPADWGFWVRFHYERVDHPAPWRSPYIGRSAGSNPSQDLGSYSMGMREQIHLKQIETATHVADFQTSVSEDRRPSPEATRNEWRVGTLDYRYDLRFSSVNDPNYKHYYAYFDGDLRPYLDMTYSGFGGDPHEDVIGLKMCQKQYPNSCILETFSPYEIDLGMGLFDHYENPLYTFSGNVKYYPDKDRTLVSLYHNFANNTRFPADALFLTKNVAPADFTAGRKLDRVNIYSKHALGGWQQENGGPFSLAAVPPTKTVAFDYDYSLVQGAPDSDAEQGGRLTLQSVSFLDPNEASILPPYRFEYGKGQAPGEPLNPRWNRNDWDRWGSYRDPSSEGGRGDFERLTPQDPVKADRAAAWSLTSVETPTGGIVDIEYEADTYRRVGDLPDMMYVDSAVINPSVVSDDRFTVGTGVSLADLQVGDRIWIEEENDAFFLDERDNNTCYYHSGFGSKMLPVTIESISGRYVYISDGFIDFKDDSYWNTFECNPENSNTFSYTMHVYKDVYGGGTRVAAIHSSSGAETYTTRYKYLDEKGRSSGVATSLPESYGNRSRGAGLVDFPDYRAAFIGHELGSNRPPPGVTYGRVEVFAEDNTSDVPRYGKTVFEYYTGSEYEDVIDISESNGHVTITDRSSRLGRPVAVSKHEFVSASESLSGTSTFREVERMETLYAYSNELSGEGDLLLRGSRVAHSPLMGAVSERYEYDDNIDGQSGRITKRQYNTYQIGSVRTQQFYSPNRTSVSKSRTFVWDVLTGKPLATATESSDRSLTIQNSEPAYWHYPGMETKHMLSQMALSETRRTPIDQTSQGSLDIDNGNQLAAYLQDSASDNDIIAATFTTWSDQFGQGAWRKNDVFAYDASYDYAVFNDASSLDIDQPYRRPDVVFPWEQISNVTAYDRYGHTIEKRARDGQYSAVIYGYADAKVTATASPARRASVFATSFENNSPGTCNSYPSLTYCSPQELLDEQSWRAESGASFQILKDDPDLIQPGTSGSARTGRQYLFVTSSGTSGMVLEYTPDVPADYQLSVWAKGASQVKLKAGSAAAVTATAKETVNGWTRYVAEVSVSSSTALKAYFRATNGGTARFDEVRLHPVETRMKTFTYDPLTWNVTTITSINGVTSYFEYDAAGRLIAARNHEGYITARHSYAIADLIATAGDCSTPVAKVYTGDTVCFNAGSSSGDAAQYRLSVAGVGGVSSSPSMTIQFASSQVGSQTARVQMLDEAGRVLAQDEVTIQVEEKPDPVNASMSCVDDPDLYAYYLCTLSGSGGVGTYEYSFSSSTSGFSSINENRYQCGVAAEGWVRDTATGETDYVSTISGSCPSDCTSGTCPIFEAN